MTTIKGSVLWTINMNCSCALDFMHALANRYSACVGHWHLNKHMCRPRGLAAEPLVNWIQPWEHSQSGSGLQKFHAGLARGGVSPETIRRPPWGKKKKRQRECGGGGKPQKDVASKSCWKYCWEKYLPACPLQTEGELSFSGTELAFQP